MGRHREIFPDDKELHKLGKELVEWAKADPKNILFSQWYARKKKILRSEWKALIQTQIFLPYYNEACSYLAERCINGSMKEGFGHRFLRLYEKDLREEENELLRLKAELARKEKEEDKESTAKLLADAIIKLSDKEGDK